MDFDKIDEGHPDYAPGEEPFHFFYNREERIAKAPLIVREYYAGRGPRPVKGIFRTLVATRGNRFMLSSIVVFAAFIWIFSFFSGRNSVRIAGTTVSITAFSYEDSVYASFKFDGISGGDTGDDAHGEGMPVHIPVTAVFVAYESSGAECDRKVVEDFFTGQELFLRTKFTDYDIIRVSCEISAGHEMKKFDAKIERH